jgi:hypothetical protein
VQVFSVNQAPSEPNIADAADAAPPLVPKAASADARLSSTPAALSPESVEAALAASDEPQPDDELEACLDEIVAGIRVG